MVHNENPHLQLSIYVTTRSDKVGVLHRHVEALLDEGILGVEVRAWANHRLGTAWLVNA